MAKSTTPAIAVSYSALVGLLGKPVDDAAVTSLLATAGKVTIKSDFIIAKEAGFDFALSPPPAGKAKAKKVLSTLFMFPEGGDGHRGFADLPSGFAFVARDALLAMRSAPDKSHIDEEDGHIWWDRWVVDGVHLQTSYRKGVVDNLTASLPDDDMGGADLSSHPLHFLAHPLDAPKDAELTGMALLVAWAAHRFGLPKKHAANGLALLNKSVTPRTFLIDACERTLTSLDVHPQAVDFLYGYTNRLFRQDEGSAVYPLLKLDRDSQRDERAYTDDFVGTFRDIIDSPFYVPDHWDAVARISAVLDARFDDFTQTAFKSAPDVSRYQQAAAARDRVVVVADRRPVVAVVVAADVGDQLVALLGKPLTDKAVKATLTAASLPIGKRIDEQANPAAGISYLGSKIDVDGKKVLCVTAVTFFGRKQTSYIRGIGASVEFAPCTAALPFGCAFGMTVAELEQHLGPASRTDDDFAQWKRAPNHTVNAVVSEAKLTRLSITIPD